MGWEISYKDERGNEHVHRNNNNVSDAKGWTEHFANKYGQATCHHVADGPYDYSGKRTHVITIGDKNK